MAKKKEVAAPEGQKTLTLPDAKAPVLLELSAEAGTHMTVASAYVIDSREMYDIASETLGAIKAAEKRAEAARETITRPLNDAKTAAIALFKPIQAMLESAKRELGAKMIKFEDVERIRVRAAEQAALIERQRAMDEANAKLAAATEALAEGATTPEAFQEAATEAMVAEYAMPMTAVADPIDRGGHGRTKRWTAEVVDLPLLLIHLANLLRNGDPTFDNTVEIKLGQLQGFAADTQGRPIPGVKFTCTETMTARAR